MISLGKSFVGAETRRRVTFLAANFFQTGKANVALLRRRFSTSRATLLFRENRSSPPFVRFTLRRSDIRGSSFDFLLDRDRSLCARYVLFPSAGGIAAGNLLRDIHFISRVYNHCPKCFRTLERCPRKPRFYGDAPRVQLEPTSIS